jgi:hypothetical protein
LSLSIATTLVYIPDLSDAHTDDYSRQISIGKTGHFFKVVAIDKDKNKNDHYQTVIGQIIAYIYQQIENFGCNTQQITKLTYKSVFELLVGAELTTLDFKTTPEPVIIHSSSAHDFVVK